jgi:hypothetical protein
MYEVQMFHQTVKPGAQMVLVISMRMEQIICDLVMELSFFYILLYNTTITS